jgi:hypothetical protein
MEDTVPFAVTPATWEVEVGGSQSETIPGTATLGPYLKNKLKAKYKGCGSSV